MLGCFFQIFNTCPSHIFRYLPLAILDTLSAHTLAARLQGSPASVPGQVCAVVCRAMWCPDAQRSLSPCAQAACWGGSCQPRSPCRGGDSQRPAALSPKQLCSHRLVALGYVVCFASCLLKQMVLAGFRNRLPLVLGPADAGCNLQCPLATRKVTAYGYSFPGRLGAEQEQSHRSGSLSG